MLFYRISSPKYIDDLSGNGAKQYGGRWNNKGTAAVYLATSRAMSVVEVLVHLRPEDLDRDYSLATFEIESSSILTLDTADLPKNWKDYEHNELLKKIGTKFIKEGEFLMLKVPSVIIEEECNFLLNPDHPEAENIKQLSKRIFRFDTRLKA